MENLGTPEHRETIHFLMNERVYGRTIMSVGSIGKNLTLSEAIDCGASILMDIAAARLFSDLDINRSRYKVLKNLNQAEVLELGNHLDERILVERRALDSGEYARPYLTANSMTILDYEQLAGTRGHTELDEVITDACLAICIMIEAADVSNKNVQYLYNDAGKFHFMDEDTYDQFELPSDIIGDQAGYIKEGDKVQAQLFNGQVISIEIPKNVPLKVTYAENAVKGDTSSSITKDAQVETGITVKVPAFIKTGDIISVDTTTGAYRERVKD